LWGGHFGGDDGIDDGVGIHVLKNGGQVTGSVSD
jgi:hypothetical protein